MSTYLISDIHGFNETFRKALKKVSLKKSDKLIILGDLIDRGPDSKGVLDTIFLLLDHGFNVQCLKGNHEQLLIDALSDTYSKVNWFRNGGKSTLQSFLVSEIDNIPKKYIDFIKSFKSYMLIDDYILVHAGVDMTKEEPLKDEKSLLWLRDWESVYDAKWLNNRKIIHGHTPKTISSIKNQFNITPHIWSIDSGIYLKNEEGYGSLAIMQLETEKIIFQKRIE